MSSPASEEPNHPEGPQQFAAPSSPGQFPEIAPGVPRYGQYAPPGYQSPFQQAEQQQQAPSQQPSAGLSGGYLAPAGQRPTANITSSPRTRPRQINSAFALIMLAGVIAFFSAIISIFLYNSAELRAMLLKQLNAYPEFSSADIDVSALISASIVIAIVLGFLLVGLYVLVAVKIRAGRNWARVLGTVLAAISLFSLISFNPLTILQVALGVFGMVYCWLPANRDYFKR